MFEKSDALLGSMAMRSNHAFGLMSFEERAPLLQEMSRLYDMFVQNLSDADIAAELNWDLVSIGQLRQEVEGRGFFR